jgi:hypothetical protein
LIEQAIQMGIVSPSSLDEAANEAAPVDLNAFRQKKLGAQG